MMPKVKKPGANMTGLMSYLAGPGKANEHTDPRIVAGSGELIEFGDGRALTHADALRVGRILSGPQRRSGADVKGGYVWHCPLSLHPDEGPLDDQTWAAIARDFVAQMGFDTGDPESLSCPWVAIRHGLSAGGNDHIHIAVSLVREDGSKASVWKDKRRAQDACRRLETRYGLVELESVRMGRSTKGWEASDLEAGARRKAEARHDRDTGNGAPDWTDLPPGERAALAAKEKGQDQPRHALARTIRGCAAAACDEADFVSRLRRSGLIVRPRYGTGAREEVTGFSVAFKPVFGERPIWYGGGKLGHDLALPRLRGQWGDTPGSRSVGRAEWARATRREPPSAGPAGARAADALTYAECGDQVAAVNDALARVPLDDTHAWTQVARQASGVLAAWSQRVEGSPGPLAEAADSLSKAAQTWRAEPTPAPPAVAALRGVALVLAAGADKGGAAQEALLLMQLMRLAEQIAKAMEAARQARLAAELVRVRADRLQGLHNSLLTRPQDRLPDRPKDLPRRPQEALQGASAPVRAVTHDSPALSPGLALLAPDAEAASWPRRDAVLRAESAGQAEQAARSALVEAEAGRGPIARAEAVRLDAARSRLAGAERRLGEAEAALRRFRVRFGQKYGDAARDVEAGRTARDRAIAETAAAEARFAQAVRDDTGGSRARLEEASREAVAARAAVAGFRAPAAGGPAPRPGPTPPQASRARRVAALRAEGLDDSAIEGLLAVIEASGPQPGEAPLAPRAEGDPDASITASRARPEDPMAYAISRLGRRGPAQTAPTVADERPAGAGASRPEGLGR